MVGHFRAFGRAGNAALWSAVVAACQAAIDHLQSTYAPATGLLPDFVQAASAADRRRRPLSPNFLEGPHDGDYDYSAGRVPWRRGTDALLNADAASVRQARDDYYEDTVSLLCLLVMTGNFWNPTR